MKINRSFSTTLSKIEKETILKIIENESCTLAEAAELVSDYVEELTDVAFCWGFEEGKRVSEG